MLICSAHPLCVQLSRPEAQLSEEIYANRKARGELNDNDNIPFYPCSLESIKWSQISPWQRMEVVQRESGVEDVDSDIWETADEGEYTSDLDS